MPKLSNFYAYSCMLTSIKVGNCPKIGDFSVDNNLLTDLNFLENLTDNNLKVLNLNNNDFESQDLTTFNRFTNLEKLYLGTTDEWWPWRDGIYNRFFGSLKPLGNMNKLKILSIEATNVNSGWEYLVSVEKLYCGSHRKEAGCLEIAKMLGEKYSRKEPYNIYSPFVHGFTSTYWDLQTWTKEHQEEIRLIEESKELTKENINLKEKLGLSLQLRKKEIKDQGTQTGNQEILKAQQLQLPSSK